MCVVLHLHEIDFLLKIFR